MSNDRIAAFLNAASNEELGGIYRKYLSVLQNIVSQKAEQSIAQLSYTGQ